MDGQRSLTLAGGLALLDNGIARQDVFVTTKLPATRSRGARNGTTRRCSPNTRAMIPAQVVLRWRLEHGVPVIPKSVTPRRIASNLQMSGLSLSADEVARIDAIPAS